MQIIKTYASTILYTFLVQIENYLFIFRLRLFHGKSLSGKYFSKNDLRENIYEKKRERKKKLIKCFILFKSVRHFTEKWLDFQLTRKMFSVDHLFFVKQTPENAENIFL